MLILHRFLLEVKRRLCVRAPFPPSALWITVIVSFVVFSQMTDYNQQDEWGQLIVEATHLTRTSSHTRAGARAHTRIRKQVRTCARSVYDSLHAPRGTVETRPVKSHAGLQASQCVHTIEFPKFSLMLEIEEQQKKRRKPIENQSGGHHCLVYICSKQENMQRFDSQKIRELF